MKRFCLILVLIFSFGCATGPAFLSDDMLANMAATEFSKLKEELPISNDQRATAQVNRVSERIANALADEMPDAEWEFVLFEDESANAFAMPGGKIAVFTGLLEHVDTDDELAAVIGHEIAHVQLRHANQRMSAEIIRGAGAILAVLGTQNMEENDRNRVLAAYGIGTQVGIMLPYSRSHESQADRVGLLIAARSGYDPRASLSFWKKMSQANKKSLPEFLSTHPSSDTRIRELEEFMPEALSIYNSNH
ncbi:MAG: M48 family metallopeptidase [Puniceicoccaceae bacterium]